MNLPTYPLLIVGLGNPGKSYEGTRHNIGFLAVKEIAKQSRICLQNKKEFLGDYGQGQIAGNKIMVLLPKTYMNLSGEAVKRCCDFFKITPERILVICDDVALPFGKLRIRNKGSCGGHNGLRNIEKYLGTMDYPRLKIGVGIDEKMDLADFVLASFNPEEKKTLDKVIENAAQVAMTWVLNGFQGAVEQVDFLTKKVSTKKSKESPEEEKKKIKDD